MATGGKSECVRLQSCEGEVFDVSLRVAKVSRTLATMLEDLGSQSNDLIPLPNVNSRILKKVIAWAEHHLNITDNDNIPTHPPASPTATPSPAVLPIPPLQPRPLPRVPQRPSPSRRMQPPLSHDLSQWDRDFITKNREDVYELLLAANYLDIKGLLDILCRTVADMIKGKDPDIIRRSFNAPTPEHAHPYISTESEQHRHGNTQHTRSYRETEV